jgi:hypothetical protein
MGEQIWKAAILAYPPAQKVVKVGFRVRVFAACELLNQSVTILGILTMGRKSLRWKLSQCHYHRSSSIGHYIGKEWCVVVQYICTDCMTGLR